jgi:heparin/heparan-sulfate lyase
MELNRNVGNNKSCLIFQQKDMKRIYKNSILYFLIFYVVFNLSGIIASAQSSSPLASEFPTRNNYIYELNISKAKINSKTTRIVKKENKPYLEWIILKDDIDERTNDETENDPDAVFHLNVPVSGIYTINTHVIREGEVKTGSKVETRFIKIQIDNQRTTKRIVSDAYNYTNHSLGRFQLTGKEQELKIWLPKGILLGTVEIESYIPVTIPPEAKNYIPKILPPAGRPRLWADKDILPTIQQRLTKGENLSVWIKLKEKALKPFYFEFNSTREMTQNAALEQSVQEKAFYYLMTGNLEIGNEAVRLILDYLSVLEFGNVKSGDITRDIGRAIYTTALVYDWCYNIILEEEKKRLCSEMMRLAEDMEIGWPPFKESIVSGHASEAQVNRDLLAMSIAIYDEDPEPYRYTSFLILEKLVPMRTFEYQSPRHSQGVDYGAYRHGWEMHAAWLFYRMSGMRIFDDNIMSLVKYWLYMRLPDGDMLRDGDMFSKSGSYWKNPQTMLLDYSYANDPIIKAEFGRQGYLPDNPILFLLLNDPDLKPTYNMNSLPLSMDFGPVLGGLVARTGWNMNEHSNDVIAEIKGGGYHFGNHQHADAGAIQLYYRGLQICDLGLYVAYGIPYDYNFNKRSIAHSMMLVIDPEEEFFRKAKNDGGTKFNQRVPETPLEVMSDPWFDNGTVVYSDFGPSTQKPLYSCFKVDLTGAYTNKVSNYTRSFCFLNLDRDNIPAIIILSDDIRTSKAEFNKFWKINTLKKPLLSDSSVILRNHKTGLVGKTHVNMLRPLPENLNLEISNRKDLENILGVQDRISSGSPEANGYQITISPKNKELHHRFLTVFQMTSDDTKPLPVKLQENDDKYILYFSDRIVCMSSGSQLIQFPFSMTVPNDFEHQILLTDLKPGFWNICSSDKKVNLNFKIESGKNTCFFRASKGLYFISPGRSYNNRRIK